MMKITRIVTGRTSSSRRSERFCAFVFAGPVQVYPGGSFTCCVDLLDGFLHRAAQISPAHAVLDRDIARVRLRGKSPNRRPGRLRCVSCASETRSPEGASSRIFSIASLVSRYCGW